MIGGRDTELEQVVRKGIEYVPRHLAALAARRALQQVEAEGELQWRSHNGALKALFYIIPDPRDLGQVSLAYARTRKLDSPITWCLVHQWQDGDGNWDIFLIRPERRMMHAGRIWGSKEVTERGPELREDIHSLFACGEPFPPPGKNGWLELLQSPGNRAVKQLVELAPHHGLGARTDGRTVRWLNAENELECAFEVLPEPSDIDAFVSIYAHIQTENCPITFVFVETDDPDVFDIFRLTRRSYLEHHNQVRPETLIDEPAPLRHDNRSVAGN